MDAPDRLYRRVPRAQWQQLAEFRAAHPERVRTIGGRPWRYLAGGAGAEVLVILPGAACLAEPGFPLIAAFERRLRVIAPSYPPVGSLDALLDGVAGLLAAEGVARAHLYGGSFGGIVAQAFARRHPARVRALILANATVLSPRWRPAARLLLALGPRLPRAAVRAPLRLIVPWTIPAPPEQRAFWRAYQAELLTRRLTRADLLGLVAAGADALAQADPPGDPARWAGPTLLLESDRDVAARPGARLALRRQYPQAQRHVFRAAGHTPWLTHHDEYVAVVAGFLDRVAASAPRP